MKPEYVNAVNVKRTAIVHYVTEEGQPATWQIAATDKDDEASIRQHAARFFPSLIVKSVEFDESSPPPTCEETWGMIGEKYLYCGKPAVMRVQHRGRSEGPYEMCLEHGCHNADNRNAEVIACYTDDVRKRYDK